MIRILLTLLIPLLMACPSWAATYYVRPQTASTYGTEEGTSYENAWNGLDAVTWGGDGLNAGDTLYICGHHSGVTSNGWSNNAYTKIVVGASGSSGSPITISGACPGDQGYIHGTGYGWPPTASWTGPDEFGAYKKSKTGSFFKVTAEYSADWSSVVELINQTKVPDGDWAAGSIYGDGTYMYWKPSDGSTSHNLCHSGTAAIIDTAGYDYINIEDLYLENVTLAGGAIHIPDGSEHINVLRNHIRWAKYTGVYSTGDTNDGSINDNEIYDCASGIYFIQGTDGKNSNRWEIARNTIYNIERNDRFQYLDAHGIGVQDGNYFNVHNNTIYNVGAWGIIFYLTGDTNTMSENIVAYNYIHDVASLSGDAHTGYGIQINGTNTKTGAMENFQIYNNLLVNTGTYGIYLKGRKLVSGYSLKVYNNTVSGAGTSLYFDGGYEDANLGAHVANNIFYSPTTKQLGGYYPDDSDGVLLQNNLFYPEGTNYFTWKSTNYNTVALLETAMGAQASGNISADPKFTSTTNFHLLPGSPAINAGVNVCTAEGVPFATCTGNGTGYWYDKDNHKVPDAYNRIPIGSSAPGIGQHLMDLRPGRTILQ
jgi:hypothetical protein